MSSLSTRTPKVFVLNGKTKVAYLGFRFGMCIQQFNAMG